MFRSTITMNQKINIEDIIQVARKAGDAIMEIYSTDFNVELKGDNSPLTAADKKSNEVIINQLEQMYPGIPRISEETKLTAYDVRKSWKQYWLIDPIDGTKEFIKRNGEFTVNIALVENGIPVLGVVYAPAKQLMYYGDKENGSFLQKGNASAVKLATGKNHNSLSKINVVASRSHLSDETLQFVEQLKQQGKEIEFVSSGSSLKFCLVAEGKADVYPRFGPTMEWDTAAGQAVIECAGGKVVNAQTNGPLLYNKENLLNPYFIVEW